jgi:peptide/nickel transport system ATP-binding protein
VAALVGESGSGKTTLGKALMKLLPENAETTGGVDMEGVDLIALEESAANAMRWSKVAMVFQNGSANLNPVYRLLDQVAEPLIQRAGLERATALDKAAEMLRHMGLPSECGRRYPMNSAAARSSAACWPWP